VNAVSRQLEALANLNIAVPFEHATLLGAIARKAGHGKASLSLFLVRLYGVIERTHSYSIGLPSL